MRKIICFTAASEGAVRTGRAMLSDLLWSAASSQHGRVEKIEVRRAKLAGLRAIAGAFFGWLDGLNRERVDDCLKRLSGCADVVIIDGSNYGRLASELKANSPSTAIVTLFHNVESKFFWDSFTHRPTLRALAVTICNYLAERRAIRNSDVVMFLNRRDAELAVRIYGRSRKVAREKLFPMSLKDDADASAVVGSSPDDPPIALFVGGAFFANVQGLMWFSKEVAPRFPCQLVVVGKGFEEHREVLEENGRITVIGTVDRLHEWYSRASFMVSPILSGSGMKTKTAEAAKYGRPVIGTPEAFVGYEEYKDVLGVVCESPDQFIESARKVLNGELAFDPAVIRAVYEKSYSLTAASQRMHEILESVRPSGERIGS